MLSFFSLDQFPGRNDVQFCLVGTPNVSVYSRSGVNVLERCSEMGLIGFNFLRMVFLCRRFVLVVKTTKYVWWYASQPCHAHKSVTNGLLLLGWVDGNIVSKTSNFCSLKQLFTAHSLIQAATFRLPSVLWKREENICELKLSQANFLLFLSFFTRVPDDSPLSEVSCRKNYSVSVNDLLASLLLNDTSVTNDEVEESPNLFLYQELKRRRVIDHGDMD